MTRADTATYSSAISAAEQCGDGAAESPVADVAGWRRGIPRDLLEVLPTWESPRANTTRSVPKNQGSLVAVHRPGRGVGGVGARETGIGGLGSVGPSLA